MCPVWVLASVRKPKRKGKGKLFKLPWLLFFGRVRRVSYRSDYSWRQLIPASIPEGTFGAARRKASLPLEFLALRMKELLADE
jgi:hypothetical protein